MTHARALRTPWTLNLLTTLFLGVWLLLAAFPFVWIIVMSFKLPLDAFSSNPWQVLFGDVTRERIGGISALGGAMGIAAFAAAILLPSSHGARAAAWVAPQRPWLGVLVAGLGYLALLAASIWLFPAVVRSLEAIFLHIPLLDILARPFIGFTAEHYQAVWVKHAFYKQFLNSVIVTFGVVSISLTVGTLAGYALSRSPGQLAFWILIVALIFRALPHSVLVTGYLPVFIRSREWLAPLWDSALTGWLFHLFSDAPPTLYGKHIAVILVLVAINQPFTIWMLRSFFKNIPSELDEAARVDGCTHFGAFWRVIVPVMWPGVITTGLFSFLLAYNDFLVTSLLLDSAGQTMVPAIAQYFNRDTSSTDQIEAVAAAVSITAPLFLLVLVFQKQIVSGLTAGAVKG